MLNWQHRLDGMMPKHHQNLLAPPLFQHRALVRCWFRQEKARVITGLHAHWLVIIVNNGPLTRYVTLRVAHAPGMPGTFSLVDDSKGNRYLAIPACIAARAARTCRDACRDRLPPVAGKMLPAFPAHAHPHFSVSGKRPMGSRSTDQTQGKVF